MAAQFGLNAAGEVKLPRPQTPDEMQLVYDEAYARGILMEPYVYRPEDRVVRVWIKDGNLHEEVAP